ncbi:hypothetical protein BU001_07825 [Mammaliicoccus sciuri]|nr:hypothetical protein BU001_07825 [Mammaliicoccus sciuri]
MQINTIENNRIYLIIDNSYQLEKGVLILKAFLYFIFFLVVFFILNYLIDLLIFKDNEVLKNIISAFIYAVLMTLLFSVSDKGKKK